MTRFIMWDPEFLQLHFFFSMHEEVLQPKLFQTAEAEMFPIGNIENLYA